jgi:putative FmdB family regulatory protein
MPLYVYACTKCQHEVEILQKYEDPPPEKCEKCGHEKMDKKASSGSFILKGGGWEKDGYA